MPLLLLFRRRRRRGNDDITAAWLLRVAAAGGTVSNPTIGYVNDYVQDLRDAGETDSSINAMRINLQVGDFAAACVPLTTGGGANVDTPVVLTAANYSENVGFTLNGTSHYFTTGLLGSTFSVSSLMMLASLASITASGTRHIIGVGDLGSTNVAILRVYSTVQRVVGYANATLVANSDFTSGVGTGGVRGISATSTTSLISYYNGTAGTTQATLRTGTLSGLGFFVGAMNNNGAAGSFTACVLTGYVIGPGKSSALMLAHTNALETLNDALGRGVI